MPYTYTLTSIIPATPQEIYQAWLDSEAHTEMTGAEAVMSDEVGAEVSAWDGYITGSNLELVPHERIVQAWRTTEFADEHDDSIVTVTLEPVEEGTLLTLVHSNVPNEHRSYEEGGWESQYFEPMKAYFARLEQEEAADEPEPQEFASASASAQADTGTAPAAPQRAQKAKAEPAQPSAKAASAPKKKKAKRAAAPKARHQTARRGAKRTGAKRAGARRAGRRGAAKRAAPKRAAGRKAAARKATPRRAAPKRTAAKKAASGKRATKSKSSRRMRARH